MLPGTVIAGSAITPASLSAKLPVPPVKTKVGAGNTFACVPKLMLPAEVNKLPVAAVNTPLSVMSPVTDVAVSVPPTVEAPKFKLEDEIAAFPALFNTTTPPTIFETVHIPPALDHLN